MRRAQRDAEKAGLTKLRRRLKTLLATCDFTVPPDVAGVGLRLAIGEIDGMLKGDDTKGRRNRQGQ